MRTKRLALGVCLGVHACRTSAAPGFAPPIIPFRNTTLSQPPTPSTCSASCFVEYPQISAIQWVPDSQIVYTTEVTVATVSTLIYTVDNLTLATRTHTSYNQLRGYSLYQVGTNTAGTAELTWSILQSDGDVQLTTLTYPTPYLDYYKEYDWEGLLPTYGTDGDSTCATATDDWDHVALPSHPLYLQPRQEFSPGKNDAFGSGFAPLYVPAKDEPNASFFQVAFPSEAAFSSCESIFNEPRIPTQYEAAKFVTETTTILVPASTTGLVVIIQPTATGWELTTTGQHTLTPGFQHLESTVSELQQDGGGVRSTQTSVSPVARIESSASDFGPGGAQQTGDTAPKVASTSKLAPGLGDWIASIIENNPSIFTDAATGKPIQRASQINLNPEITPAPVAPVAAPTAVFTFVPTVIIGHSTTIPAFILPGSSETATIGQSVTVNGQLTVLAAPPVVFTQVQETISGHATLSPAFIISGTSTASIGQTITLDGQTTVLNVPLPVLTMFPTTIDGTATTIPVYIVDGTSTASLGETITLANGQTTALSAPSAVISFMSTTIHGVATLLPVYVINGTRTATPGETVVINGSTTVLAMPTTSSDIKGTGSINSDFGGPVVTSSGPRATTTGGNTKGAGSRNGLVSVNGVLLVAGAATLWWL